MRNFLIYRHWEKMPQLDFLSVLINGDSRNIKRLGEKRDRTIPTRVEILMATVLNGLDRHIGGSRAKADLSPAGFAWSMALAGWRTDALGNSGDERR